MPHHYYGYDILAGLFYRKNVKKLLSRSHPGKTAFQAVYSGRSMRMDFILNYNKHF